MIVERQVPHIASLWAISWGWRNPPPLPPTRATLGHPQRGDVGPGAGAVHWASRLAVAGVRLMKPGPSDLRWQDRGVKLRCPAFSWSDRGRESPGVACFRGLWPGRGRRMAWKSPNEFPVCWRRQLGVEGLAGGRQPGRPYWVAAAKMRV